MHAPIEHLLSVRDAEPVDAGIAEHVGHCAICSANLRRLSLMREQLQAMPQLHAPEPSWEQIQLRMARSEVSSGRRGVAMIAAAAAIVTLAAIAALAILGGGTAPDAPLNARSAQPAATGQGADGVAHVAELVVQSQELDHLLQTLPERPRVERVSTAATIDTIQQRIQWLDYQLSDAPDSALSEAQARRLWRERVELMDSLVKVRYAEAGRASF
jgi:hypothetical protein